MKQKLQKFLVKAFSLCLAFILVFPTNLFAMGLDNTKTRKYNSTASIMGLAQTDTTSQNDEEVTGQTLLETEITNKETDKYLIEKYAKLSKTTGLIEYIIKVQAKDKKAEDKVTTSFAISKNTDLEDLKIEKVSQIHSDNTETEIKHQEEKPSILYTNDAFETLGVTTEKADLVYYLSAKLTDDALANIDDKSPTMDLDVNIGEDYQDRYGLTIDKTEVVGEDGQVDSTIQTLKEKEDPIHQVKAIYKEESTLGEITWTDYIHTTDDKEFTYDINVDDGQDATDSLIKVEFYQATEKGYILKEDFTKEIPFTNSLKLQIPLGFIAKVELKTKVIKNLKEYSLNKSKISNPIYKEEKTEEESEEDDADPLPEESPDTKESNDSSEEKIIPVDPETNEAVIDHSLVKEDTKEESEPTKEETSAIDLNRDSVISNFKNKDKLNPIVEITINNISSLFNAYNNDEMTYEEFLASLKLQAGDISKEDFTAIVEGLIAGLNQETYKVATIDQAQLADEIFAPEEKSEGTKSEGKEEAETETKESDTEETSNAETKTTEDIRTNDKIIKDNALESFDKSLSQAKEASKKPQEDDRSFVDNLSEGFKGIFGQSNLQKADKELKEALAAGQSLEEIQALLDSFEEKYQLSREEQVTLMEDNNDAIKALIAKDSETNFRPHIFADTDANTLNLDGKKFNVRTIFQTSNALGAIQPGQYFNIHLDNKLKVNDPNSLEPIRHNGSVIAEPEYDSTNNVIKYKITKEINDNLNIPLEIPVDYDTTDIHLDADGTFTVVNRVSGLGVVDPKPLLPEVIDKNGNPAGTILEPGRHDVIQIFDDENNRNYSVNIDADGTPIVEQGELLGFNWSVKVHSTDDLKGLGFKLNLTAVKGSGLKEIQNVMINGQKADLTDQLEGAFGIVDSKYHDLQYSTKDLTYTFYTPVDRKQSSYMLDISGILTKKNNQLGAARLVLDEGYKPDAITEATSTRIGMNNRTTIQGKFDTKDTATWTVTDGVSSGDEAEQNTIKGLPLETRKLGGKQDLISAKTAVYGINSNTGQMEAKKPEESINPPAIPEKTKNPTGVQAVGNIAVYEFGTNLTDAADDETKAKDYSLSGVSISKYKDIVVEQIWNLPEGGKMPAQKIEVKEKGTDQVVASIEVGEEEGNTRLIRIPDVKFWDFDDKGVYIAKKLYIDQNLPTDQVNIGYKNYKYYENANYYQEDIKVYQIRNAAIEVDNKKPGSFKVVKVDKEKDEKGNPIKLPGAKFSLLGANVEVTTDKNGEANFTNIKPGSYTLRETKAPSGYKLDQDSKYVTIDSNGNVIIKGNNVDFSTGTGGSGIVEHNNAPNWPDFMNTMHYSTVDRYGNSVLYVYLKPRAQEAGGSTNKDTIFNISLPGVNLGDDNVDVYDINPYYRSYYRSALEDGSIENANFGSDVINQYSRYSQTITGKRTQTGGYQINFPSSRFGNDWGFMVKVTANLGNKQSEELNYKWQVDGNPNDSHIEQNVTLNKTKQAKGVPTLTITNEAFEKSEIEVTKFANSFSTVTDEHGKQIQKRDRLPGAEFVLKDSEGNLIANKVTDANGHVSFGEFPPGVYRLEEVSAPNGYQKSNVYFEVTVNDSKEVSYVAKFLSGSGQPVVGVDYWIEKGEETQADKKANVTSVNQRLEYNENKEGSWGTKTNVWEAYMFESLKYHADITLKNVSPGSRFEIQFDPNLDFTQYFSDFPKIRKDGKDIADPYFDYNTNLLTYVFNENSASLSTTTVTIDLKGMIPDKYYFQNSGTKNFSVTVAPGTDKANTITKDINADYSRYDTAFGQPSQSYYFRDIYQGDDDEWYVTALAYFNPLADYTSTKTLQFNWMSTNYDKTKLIARQEGKGYRPAFDLVDVKVYETEPNLGTVTVPPNNEVVRVNFNMPLSFGVRPEQDPNTYTLLYSTGINPGSKTTSSQNGVTLEYDPSKIITSGGIHTSFPLRVKMPPISGKKEGFIVEQTFKVTDMKNFINLSRMFYMNNGSTYKGYGFESAFTNSANFNKASADQTGVEIPKYYREDVGIINNQYIPGNFKITKLNQADNKEKLTGAIFVLRPENGSPIYRTSNNNGEVSFKGLAPGRYVLDEFRAPKGFQKTDKQWQVIVFNDGNVRITESSITGSEQTYQGNEINIEVTNKPEGEEFVVYKKDGNGQALKNAEFKLTKQGDPTFEKTVSSDENGLVKFGELQNGTYIIEETNPPAGYKKLGKKWVLVIDADGKRVYNYRKKTSGDQNENLLSETNTKWINVKDRSKDGWGYNDNRTTGWVANSTRPFKLGTRIVAINKNPGEGKQPYVIQRYVINPEAAKIEATSATIHRENPHDPNMSWYAGNESYKVYKLEKPVTGFISDMRLDDFGATDITGSVSKSAKPVDGKYGEPQRLKLDFPATDKPIVIDVKIPYTYETGGVGTGMDWTEGGTTYWKSDFYERVDIIKEAGLVNPTTEDGQTSIVGAYISEDSLDVTNELKTFGFKIKKVNDDKTNPKVVPGAKFKLTNTKTNEEIERTSGSDGMISFDGLKPGSYTLEETEAAPGYEKTNSTWTITVANDGKVYIKDNIENPDANNPSFEISTTEKFATNNLMRRLEMAGANTEPEIGGNIVDTLTVTDGEGNPVEVTNNSFTMPESNVTESATFKQKEDHLIKGEKEIPEIGFAKITNKQVGLDFKVFKSDIRQRPLEGAEFELFKADEKYNITEDKDEKGNPIASIKGVSEEDGNVKFVDKDDNPAKLQPGYYVMKETKSPQGYKKITADWKIRVYEKDGILKAEYKGPKDTPSSYLSSKSAYDKNTLNTQGEIALKDAGNGIKYASRINYIDPDSKTFVQRIYIDTRGYNGNEKINVDITPVIKREEIDTPGARPKTTKPGVKTAYRTTYKIGSPNTNTDVTKGNYEQILRYYDLADDNVSMINTARWRPFDWGFDEDQLNLDKGVYFIDVEGFYDDNITKEDIGKIEMNVKFQTERYFYSLAKDKYGNFYWEKDGSYQAGAAALGAVYKEDVKDSYGNIIHKKGDPTEWGRKLSKDGKYPNWIGKEVVWTNGKTYKTGIIAPPGRGRNLELGTVTTSVDISSLYSADGVNQIGQDGMDIINDEETYNITFSKHGQDSSDEDINSQAVTERRLEGGVFKLQEEVAPNIYRDLPESTVASAFNGYFGFRGLSPGRYRLMEVQAPKGYRPINEPLLYFTVDTVKTNSGKIVHPETGQIVDIKSIKIKFSDEDKEAHKLSDLQMVNKKSETVNIKDVKSTDINVETTKIINPHETDPDKKQVFLKDLKIVGDNGTYDIAQAKIVPGSSGYISLEYDRANGVYQYVKEKTTSEKDGKLVDFVTSATAKNMGKIINTKPGEGELTVKKVDQKGDAIEGTELRPGAEFKLTNKLDNTSQIKTVGEDGTIKFDNLRIGQYQLEEIKSPDGYINTKQIWNFTIGGEGLDPYSGPAPQRRQDLSDKITLESTMKVVNPDTENHTAKAQGEIHPHLGEAFEFENKFKIAEGTKINPGDYFTIKLTDNIDLNGIFENNIEGLDILADGIGTVAKADYNRYAGTITYTFTDYADAYTLTNFSNKLSAFINLDEVQNSDTNNSKQKVGLSLGNSSKEETIKVVYDSMTARENSYYDHLNLGSKITKFNPETGEFVHYYYINRDQNSMNGPVRFKYSSEQNIENLEISSYALLNWSKVNLKRVMPESFGVNEYDPYLPRESKLISGQTLGAYVPATINYKNGIGENESYIIKVTGRVSGVNKMAYVGHGKLEKVYDYPGYFLYVNRHDEVRKFVNSATADGILEIQAVNPENKIKFIKVDQDNKPLSGATFTLYIQNSEGNWNVYGDNGVKPSGDDGIVEFSKLKPGKYKIEETVAPTGYDKIDGSILEFEVDASGRILRDRLKSEAPETKPTDSTDETNPGNKTPVKIEEPGIAPIPVVNKKKQEISFKKVDATDDSITLEGAEFEVWHKLEKGDEYSKLNIYEKTTDGKTERLALRGDAPQGYTAVKDNKLTSGKDGIVKFGFYDSGYYALKEIKAPKSYVKPKDFVREFVVVDGKIQENVHKTEMEVNKTIGSYYVNGSPQDVYNTDMTLTINSDHEKITYTKDKSKITLSGLPYDNDLAGTKLGISIYAKLVDKKNNSSPSKYYPVDPNNYTDGKGSITIDLYGLVKELDKKTGDSFESENTIELSMYSTLALDTTLEIKSNLVIGDGENKISEERSFNIGTEGDKKVDHSYTFTKLGEPGLPIPIENKKSTYPLTGGNGVFTGFAIIGTAVMLLALAYFGIYQNDKNRRRSAR